MRTTLTLGRDVAEAIEREMRRRDASLKSVVNDGLRRGLGLLGKAPEPTPFEVQPHSFGILPGIDQDKFHELIDELEAPIR